MIGPRPNLFGIGDEADNPHWRLEVKQPILTNEESGKNPPRHDLVGDAFKTRTLDAHLAG